MLVLLIQLPIPPPGPQPIGGNVPLAAAYLKLFARRHGCDRRFQIELLPPALANTLGDQALVEAILGRQPALVGFTCYLWNIERTLWIVERLKQRRPALKILLGGPEITPDNRWVLQRPGVDYAVFGEGEQTFVELLQAWSPAAGPVAAIPGLWTAPGTAAVARRDAMESLDAVSSPYVEGILDAAAERTMLLETVRGCLFKCRYCYYPKSHQSLRMLSAAQIDANLRYAIQRAVPEVFFLDPTLNQRPDFHDFLHGLVRANADGQLAFSGELRGEGIDPATARLLRKANFKEVEIGLQSIEPRAQELMGRRTNLKALEAGVRALLDEGIDVQLDMIVGLPGDTADSIRRGLDYLVRVRPFSRVQVFNLSILPGTSFRQDAAALGLEFQPRPPYYVLRTPTLDVEQMRLLMAEAEDAFGIEFDALPPPQLEALGEKTTFRFAAADLSPKRKRGTPPGDPRLRFGLQWGGCMVDLDRPGDVLLPPAAQRAQAFTLWLRSADFPARQRRAAQLIEDLLADNPHTTLQVVLEPRGDPRRLDVAVLETLLEACHTSSSYLDWYYSLHPTGLLGAKRLVVVVPRRHRGQLGRDWIEAVSDVASIVWWGDDHEDEPLEPCEYQIAKLPGIARNFPRP